MTTLKSIETEAVFIKTEKNNERVFCCQEFRRLSTQNSVSFPLVKAPLKHNLAKTVYHGVTSAGVETS